jgi:pimeloyl-ACP methyl ester carboxylesterase
VDVLKVVAVERRPCGEESAMREEMWTGQVHGYLYPPAGTARYHLLIAHGVGGHGGTYDVFCAPMAERGVSVYSIDLPGHGLARNERGDFRFIEWLEDIDAAARFLKTQADLPVFVLGSSQGSAAAFHSLAYSDAVDGAVTMGIVLTGVPTVDGASGRIGSMMTTDEAAQIAHDEGDERRLDLQTLIDWDQDYAKDDTDVLAKKLTDPLRAWSYGWASLHSYWNYEPPVPPSENRKPVLVTVGGDDPMLPGEYVDACFERIGGPKEKFVMDGAGHQLMLYCTEQYVDVVDSWISRTIEGEGASA